MNDVSENRGNRPAAAPPHDIQTDARASSPLHGIRQPGPKGTCIHLGSGTWTAPPQGGVGQVPFLSPLAGVRERPWFGAPFFAPANLTRWGGGV